MVSKHVEITYVRAPAKDDDRIESRRNEVCQIIRENKLFSEDLKIIPFNEAVDLLNEFEANRSSLRNCFGDILILEAVEIESYRGLKSYGDSLHIVERTYLVSTPLELSCRASILDASLAIIICNLTQKEFVNIPIMTFSSDDPSLVYKIYKAYSKVRLGLSVTLPSLPFVTVRGDTLGESFHSHLDYEMLDILNYEMPDTLVQQELVLASMDPFRITGLVGEVAVVAHVCRYLSRIEVEGISFRTGMVMLNRSNLDKRIKKLKNPPELSWGLDSYPDLLKQIDIVNLKVPLSIDMRNIDQISRLAEGIDGIHSALIIDSYGVAYAIAISDLSDSNLDIDDFQAITNALMGVGFFVPGDRTVYVTAPNSGFPYLRFVNDRWRLDGNRLFDGELCWFAFEIGIRETEIFKRVHHLARILSRNHLGSFIVMGHRETLDDIIENNYPMRTELSSIFVGKSVQDLSDLTLIQILGIDGSHFVTFDGEIRALGIQLTVKQEQTEGVGKVATGTKRATAKRLTQLHDELIAITVSHDGPITLWRKGHTAARAPL
jgi:hypothetical protein